MQGLKLVRLPYLLTLQLKRFDFDVNTFQRIKLHDRCVRVRVLALFLSLSLSLLSLSSLSLSYYSPYLSPVCPSLSSWT